MGNVSDFHFDSKANAKKKKQLRSVNVFFALANELHCGCCAFCAKCPVHSCWLIGTLSKDDGDGSENFAKKMNLSSFKLNRVYLVPV